MLSYESGSSIAHRLDPRSKLAVQFGFAGAAFAYTTPRGLAVLTVLALGILAVARVSPLRALYAFRFFLPFLVAGPLIEAATIGSPWFVIDRAVQPALASYRVLLVVFVAAAYIVTTPARESRAAIQWLVPGKAGQFLGTAVALVFRFLPLLRGDLARARDAVRARCGEDRPVTDRIRIVATAGLQRAFDRADHLALAMRARCFAWNPTLPPLSLGALDWLVLGVAAVLFAVSVIGGPIPLGFW